MTTRAAAGVLVVGGGVAGLVAAHDLARAGLRVTLIERSDRLGGQIEATQIDGRTLDVGAESFATRGLEVAALLDELGLAASVVAPTTNPAWVHDAAGRSYPLPEAGVLGIPVHPAHQSIALGRLGAVRAACDALLPRTRLTPTSTVGDVVAARMGRRVRDRLVDPVVRGVYSSAAGDLALMTASPALARELTTTRTLARAAARVRAASPSGSQVAGLRGGMSTLIDALASRLGELGVQIRLGVDVTPADLANHRDTLGVRAADVAGADLAGVVVAAPGLVGTTRTQRRITVVAAAVSSRALDAAPRGTGVLVASAAAVGARALTHSSAKWGWLAPRDGVHLVRLSYDVAPDDDASVQADVRALTGADDAVVIATATRTWVRTIAVDLPPGIDSTTDAATPTVVVGEAAGRTGLAAVVAQARAATAELIDRLTTQGDPS